MWSCSANVWLRMTQGIHPHSIYSLARDSIKVMKPYAHSFHTTSSWAWSFRFWQVGRPKEIKRNWRQLQLLDMVVMVDNPSGIDHLHHTFVMNWLCARLHPPLAVGHRRRRLLLNRHSVFQLREPACWVGAGGQRFHTAHTHATKTYLYHAWWSTWTSASSPPEQVFECAVCLQFPPNRFRLDEFAAAVPLVAFTSWLSCVLMRYPWRSFQPSMRRLISLAQRDGTRKGVEGTLNVARWTWESWWATSVEGRWKSRVHVRADWSKLPRLIPHKHVPLWTLIFNPSSMIPFPNNIHTVALFASSKIATYKWQLRTITCRDL